MPKTALAFMDDDDDRPDLESTQSLIRRIRREDPEAPDQLVRRYRVALYRYATGRMPPRDLAETGDAVHDALMRAVDRLDKFQYRGPGSLLRYLKMAVDNRIRDAWRREYARRDTAELNEDTPDPSPTPIEDVVGQDIADRYKAALLQLEEREAEAVILRIELESPFQEIADQLGFPSANAARMAVTRALKKISDFMR